MTMSEKLIDPETLIEKTLEFLLWENSVLTEALDRVEKQQGDPVLIAKEAFSKLEM